MDNPEVVAWICLVVGVLVLGLGCLLGALVSTAATEKQAQDQIDDAKQKIDETKSEAEQQIAQAQASVGANDANATATATAAVDAKAEAAKSALEQISGIIAALPEKTRFAGLLVLVGTVLISVATIQFGGTSLF